MIDGLKPYSSMKDSGLTWLGEVPEHWVIKRGKSNLVVIDERSKEGSEELLTVSSARGVVLRNSANVTMFKAESYAGYKLCWPGDLVINSLWAWAGGLGVSQYHGIISTAYSVYRSRPSAQINPRFLHELVRSSAFHLELHVRSKGVWTSRLQLTDTAFLDVPIPLPPPDEQAAIVKYLDYVDRRIRRYIRAKQKLIKLLEEQKQAIIHRAVTGQIDVRTGRPYPAYKPSGIPWLGDIPKHWEVRKLRTISELIVSNVDKHSNANEMSVRLCNYVDVYKNDTINERLAFMHATATSDEIARFRIRKCDVIITKDSEEWDDIGIPSLVIYEAEDLVCGYHLAVLRPHDNCCTGTFLHRVLENRFVATQMYTRANGVTRYGLSYTVIKDVLIPLPPILEQGPICSYLNENLEALMATTTRFEREIDLLREYRTRLIADVVTGKLDVREAAARLPDEPLAPEPEPKESSEPEDIET